MSRLFTTGLEIGPIASVFGPDGFLNGTGVTRDTSIFRSGISSVRINTSGASGYVTAPFTVTTVAGTSLYMRAWVRFASHPSASKSIISIANGELVSNGCFVYFDASFNRIGVKTTNSSGTAVMTYPSVDFVPSTGVWYMFELKLTPGTGTTDVAEIRVNGADLVTSPAFALGDGASVGFFLGTDLSTGTFDVNYDDVAINNSTGPDQDSWPGDAHIVLMKPVSDHNVGSWTGGAGGTTNLFDAVDNTPPTGTASETNATQIESVDTSGDNATDEYRANLGTSWLTHLPSHLAVPKIIIPWCCHGEDVNTGAKTGSFGMSASPSQTYTVINPFGPIAGGALGTYPTNWQWQEGSIIYDPVIDFAVVPKISIRKTDTGTRVASCCFLGAYMEYVTNKPAPAPMIIDNAVVRASRW